MSSDGILIHGITTLSLFVVDADAVHEACVAQGADIVVSIDSKPWRMREFMLRDINGHLLRTGHGEKLVSEIERFQVNESAE